MLDGRGVVGVQQLGAEGELLDCARKAPLLLLARAIGELGRMKVSARSLGRLGRDDVLVFDTPPLAADTEVTGPIRAEIFASADVPDFDLWVRLLDVAHDGSAFNLMSPGLDVLRASYRNASLKPELLTPGRVYLLTLDHMLTSNVFRAGHRIRVQISAAFSPHFSRNLQTGESEITSSQTQLGHIRIYHDAEHSSRIVLPVIPRAKRQKN